MQFATGPLLSFLAVTLAASIWIWLAVAVAFPAQILHLAALYQKFYESGFHSLVLSLLLAVDILLAIGLLNDERMFAAITRRWALITTILCFIVFITMAFVVKGSRDLPIFDQNPRASIIIALGIISIPRALTYAVPQLGVSVPNSFNR